MIFSGIATASDVAEKVSREKDAILMKQLNWLCSRGILLIESKPGKFLQASSNGEISYHQEIELVVKSKEHIEKLEAQVKQLKSFQDKIMGVITTLEKEQLNEVFGSVTSELDVGRGE